MCQQENYSVLNAERTFAEKDEDKDKDKDKDKNKE